MINFCKQIKEEGDRPPYHRMSNGYFYNSFIFTYTKFTYNRLDLSFGIPKVF